MTLVPGPGTGWHARPDHRLDAFQARAAATRLEHAGWRAEAVATAQGLDLVEVRDLAVRPHLRVATLWAPGEAEAFLAARGHGLLGRVPASPDGAVR
jgi:hypothetical protein